MATRIQDSPRPSAGSFIPLNRQAPRGWWLVTVLVLGAAGLAAPARAEVTSGAVGRSEATRATAGYRLAKKTGKRQGDSAGDTEASKGKGEDPAAAGKPGAAKSGAKSGESLDNLMNDVVSDEKAPGKGKKRDDREMDALLKDVQKTDPAPAAKKEAPPPAPPLSPSDISTAMAQAKVRGNACAQRFGRGGTAELKVTVARDGKVTDVQLGGKLVGTPVASCIEQAVKSVGFRPNAGLRFDYRMDVR